MALFCNILTDQNTKLERDEPVCPKGHSWLVAETSVKPGSADPPRRGQIPWPLTEDTGGLGGREAPSAVTLTKQLS